MIPVFTQGNFHSYAKVRLDESRATIPSTTQFASRKTTVFVSHKHDELADLKDILGFLEKQFGVMTYIDSRDPTMPKVTSVQTATNIKERIVNCDKFILLATNGAIESKWCNWELGFGDAKKFEKNIALFPMKSAGGTYSGSEYMSIYPCIAYYDGTEKYSDGSSINAGYYIRTQKIDGSVTIKPLAQWFASR
jgi:hypothetical protein